jgi:hypothetical protein
VPDRSHPSAMEAHPDAGLCSALEIKAVLCTIAGDLKETSRTFLAAGDIYNEGGPTCACVPDVAAVANVDHTKTERQHIDESAKLQSRGSNQQ